MQKAISFILITSIIVTGLITNAFSGMGNLAKDSEKNPIPSFVPDPAKSQVNSDMTGIIKFAKDGSGNVNINNWMVILVHPTLYSTYYYNNDSTKTFPLPGGMFNLIFVSHPGVRSVTVQFGKGTASDKACN